MLEVDRARRSQLAYALHRAGQAPRTRYVFASERSTPVELEAPVRSLLGRGVETVRIVVARLVDAARDRAGEESARRRGDEQPLQIHSASQVHDERPQPLLRAVVVLRIRLDEQNKWQAEVFRDNPDQPEMTQAALESVAKLPAPVGLSPKAAAMLRGEGVVEAWLFQNDGRFALKTLAKPQRGA